MGIGLKTIAAPVALGVAVLVAAAASGSVPDSPAPEADDWRNLAIAPISHGSTSGAPAAPTAAVELAATSPQAAPPPPASGPRRLTGVAGADLNRALAAAGAPDAIVQDYLRALAMRIALADGISVQDRFDLVVDGPPGAEQLVYAGLDRVAASDVQLMRWVQDGRADWVDATGTAAEMEAMGMPVAGRVSSRFGMRSHPILHSRRFHRGIDVKAAAGTPIRAAADGRVAFAGWSGGYGRQVRIGHDGGLATSYSHMSRIAAAPGAFVRRGQVIGYVGSSGLSTGPHLHYEVFQNGRPVDPATVRYAGGEDSLDKQERRAFNSTLRHLLTAAWNS